jgi:hypothetical protein
MSMDSADAEADFYMKRLKDRQFEDAFHGLVEADHCIIPKLIEAFRNEAIPDIRAELVKIIWNHRQTTTMQFLVEALYDKSPKVWKNALDGLVTLATPETLQPLKASLTRQFATKSEADDFRKWVEEAIQQILAKES